jgi:predicted Fe-Mo cluster-binding NifX family protein
MPQKRKTKNSSRSQRKLLLTLYEHDISPRFDLTTEVLIIDLDREGAVITERTIVLPHASAEELCHLILMEGVAAVICGGIEEQFYQYLTWKKINVMDSVMGPWSKALSLFRQGELKSGAVLFDSL